MATSCQTCEPSGALLAETLIAFDLGHVAIGLNVRGYRYSRAARPAAH